MIRVQAWNEFVSPKFYCPLYIWPWLKISPQSSLNVIYCLILTAWQWLMSFTYMPCIPMQINSIKPHWGKGSWPFSFESSATFPPQVDHVLVDLFSSVGAGGVGQPCRKSPPPTPIYMMDPDVMVFEEGAFGRWFSLFFKIYLLLSFSFFNIFYWLCYYSCPIFPTLSPSTLHTPSHPHSPTLIHVHGLYI